MRFITVAALAGSAVAYPGMPGKYDGHASVFGAIMQEAKFDKRQAPPPQPVDLIGDLSTSGGTATNQRIMGCFNSGPGAGCTDNTNFYTKPGSLLSSACKADTCCVWSYIADELAPLFKNSDGTCNKFARKAVRFGFHDAGAWDTTKGPGGADGSLLLSSTEVGRPANAGLAEYKSFLLPILLKYSNSFSISAADLVQFAHNVAVVVCPLGPRGLTYVGRPDWKSSQGEAPDGLLPDANSPAADLLKLFVDKTIHEVDLVALIGAHTTATQTFFDPSQAGLPLDKTPGVWDVSFYSEVLAGAPPSGVFRLPSDSALQADPTSAGGFNAFSAPNGAGQALWNTLYAKAYLRLSLLGVQSIQGLTDCTFVLPPETPVFNQTVSSSSSSAIRSSTSSVSSISSRSSSASRVSTASSVSARSTSSVSKSSSSARISSSSSTRSFSQFSFFGNSTRPTVAPSSSKFGGNGDGPKATSSKFGGNGDGPKATSSRFGGNDGPKKTSSGVAPKPTSSGSFYWGDDSKGQNNGYGDGWPKTSTTSTIWETKTITVTQCPPEVKNCPWRTSTTVVPKTTSCWEVDVPAKTTTTTTTRTSTITLHGGKVTVSVWADPVTTTVPIDGPWWVPVDPTGSSPWKAPVFTVTAAPVKPASCIVKTVSVTVTAWA